jgi:hypothetical protein
VSDRTVTITDRDVEFVRLALAHYRLFAETVEKQGESRDQQRSLGVFRAQEFYAERFLSRLEKP